MAYWNWHAGLAARRTNNLRGRRKQLAREFVAPESLETRCVLAAPTDISLDNDTVVEDSAAGTLVGTFSTADPDVGDTFTYTLVTGTGDTDNDSFTIVGDELQTNVVIATPGTLSVRVRSTDQLGELFEESLEIVVEQANSAPTDLALSNTDIDPAGVTGDAVGTFTTTDPDTGDTFTYELVAGAGDTDNGSFTITGDQLLLGFDVSGTSQTEFSVRVRTTDSGGEFFEKEFVLNVTEENAAPTDIALSSTSVSETEVDLTVGTFTTTDPDTGETFTYALVAGAGSDDNGLFVINGDQLVALGGLDFETQSSATIRVRSTDAGGLFFEESFVITILDVDEDAANRAFVEGLYDDVLNRVPSAGEGDGWVDALNAGLSRSDVAGVFLDSVEYTTLFINRIYNHFLGRDADVAGLDAWSSFLAGGGSERQLLDGILASDEYFVLQGGNNADFVAGLYADLLGRAPDLAGQEAWVNALDNDGVSRAAVADGFVASDEFIRLLVDDPTNVVPDTVFESLYQGLLNRNADQAGLDAWVGAILAGTLFEDAQIAFLASDEYFALQSA